MFDPKIAIPVSLLLALYDQASASGKDATEACIRDYKKHTDRKGHVAEGFRKTAEGSLIFDKALYDEAVYRGKVSTYTIAAKEKIESLKNSLELLQTMSEEQKYHLKNVPVGVLEQRIGQGDDISDETLFLLGRIRPMISEK